MDALNNLSFMTKIYLIEAISVFLISIIIGVIWHFMQKNKLEQAVISRKLYLYPIRNQNTIIIPFVICFIGLALILVQYIFEKPQIDSTITLDVFSSISEENFKVMYHNKNILEDISDIKNIDTSKIGTYNINLKIPYLGKYIEKNVTLNIDDITPPELNITYSDGSEVPYTVDLSKEGFSITDNYDSDIASKLTIAIQDLGDNKCKVTYSATDTSGNKTEKTITVKIIDNVPPEINLKDKNSININLGDTYNEPGATAQDIRDGDLTDKIQITSNVDTSNVGKYSVTYTVSDNSGNSAEVTRIVNVVEPVVNNGVIYLTFDDGPSSSTTPYILDILKEKSVKATFFVINYSDSNEYLIQREVQEGHTVGLHGYSHNYSDIYSSVDAFMDNITSLRTKIKNSTGFDTNIIRFPGGSSNTISKNYCPGIMTALTKKVIADGYSYFDWNIDCNDAGGAKSSTEVYNNVVNHLSMNGQNVVLMHDFSGNKKTLNALSDIIDYGLNNGYRFERITSSTPMVIHHVYN